MMLQPAWAWSRARCGYRFCRFNTSPPVERELVSAADACISAACAILSI